MDQVTLGLVGLAAIGACWDGFRRYLVVRRFNQVVIDRQERIEHDHKELEQRVKNINEKLSLNLTGSIRPNRVTGLGR